MTHEASGTVMGFPETKSARFSKPKICQVSFCIDPRSHEKNIND